MAQAISTLQKISRMSACRCLLITKKLFSVRRRWARSVIHGRMQHVMKQPVGAQAPSPRA